jgi:hypothetical protein
MDNEILVKEFRKILRILEREHKQVALFMLKVDGPEMMNLIVSTPVYDKMTAKNGLKHLIGIANRNFTKEILRKIIRLTVLKTDDPFVVAMNQTFKAGNAVKHIYSSVISGIYIESAIVFKSGAVARHKKTAKEVFAESLIEKAQQAAGY